MESFIGLFFFLHLAQRVLQIKKLRFNYSYHSLSYWWWEYCALYIMFSSLLICWQLNDSFLLNFRLYRSDYGLRFLWCVFAILKYLVILVKKNSPFMIQPGKKTTSPLTPVLSETHKRLTALCLLDRGKGLDFRNNGYFYLQRQSRFIIRCSA